MNIVTDHRPGLLRRLDGMWTATGDVRGKPVRYHVSAGPALQGRFTEISMEDVEAPPRYEARIFLGFDAETGTIIAHWMDCFGARFSVPHGSGSLGERAIEFVVPYESGAFKDRFEFDETGDTWTLEITAHQPDDSWAHFAGYTLRRAG